MRRLLSFPSPVNEVSVRLVAGGVVMCLAAIILDRPLLTLVIAYGFVARVLTGPTAIGRRPARAELSGPRCAGTFDGGARFLCDPIDRCLLIDNSKARA
jgi:hypothetical protein